MKAQSELNSSGTRTSIILKFSLMVKGMEKRIAQQVSRIYLLAGRLSHFAI